MCGGFAFYSGNPLVENLKLDKTKNFHPKPLTRQGDSVILCTVLV